MKPHRMLPVLVFVAAFSPSLLFSQRIEFSSALSQNWAFIENKGQLADENGTLLGDIHYYGMDRGVNIYCRNNSIAFVFHQINFKEEEFTDPGHFGGPPKVPLTGDISTSRAELHLLGANPDCEIIASKPRPDYLNFYYAHTPENGITGVQKFEVLLYRNIYQNIDLKLYVKNTGLKYEFIIHPGGNVNNIKMHWEGTVPELLQNGAVSYLSQLGYLTETAPVIYTETNKKLEGKFTKIDEHTLGFRLKDSNFSETIIIDPLLQWATYFGAEAEDIGSCMELDKNASRIIGGYTTMYSAGLATSGAFQDTFGGGWGDGFLAKFSAKGDLLWSTYFGGLGDDWVSDLVIDKNNNICIVGATESTTGIATSGTYQSSYADSQDIFIGRFNTSGFRDWCSYLGGTTFDAGNRIILDKSGNLVISAICLSSGLGTTGAYQSSLGGFVDGFVAKFNDSGTRLLAATYFGGSSHDVAGAGLALHKSGNILIAGYTKSTTKIASNGVHQEFLWGNWECYVAMLKDDLSARVWATYFGGPMEDFGGDLCTDDTGNIYFLGSTESDTAISTPKAYREKRTGGFDMFLTKFSDSGKVKWSTYFGGDDGEFPTKLTMNDSGNLLFCGYTVSDTGIAGGACPWQSSRSGGVDCFLGEINSNGSFCWGSYYGGPEQDVTWDIANTKDTVLLTGSTYSASGIATKGSHKDSGAWDAFLAKFVLCCPKQDTLNIAACEGYTHNGTKYTQTGKYTQRFSIPGGCDSTLILNITVHPKKLSNIKAEACDSFKLNGARYDSTGDYIQQFKDTFGCDSTINLSLTINRSKSYDFSAEVCDSFFFNDTTLYTTGVYTFLLKTTKGCDSLVTLMLKINNSRQTHLYVDNCYRYIFNGQTYTSSGIYTFKHKTSRGCDSTVFLHLTVHKSTKYVFSVTACDSFILNGHPYFSSGTYTQVLVNSMGCDSLVIINVKITPSLTSFHNLSGCDSVKMNDITYFQTGAYAQKFKSAGGCDSTLILSVQIWKPTTTLLTRNVCDSFVLNGIAYKSTGIYQQQFSTSKGCDSILHLDLTIRNSTDHYLKTEACNDVSVNGILYTTSGYYLQKYVNPVGCDYNVWADVTILPLPRRSYATTACNVYTSRSGKFHWTNSGIYYDTIDNTSGCDSVLEVNLTINHIDTSVSQVSSNVLKANASGLNYQWLDCGLNFSRISGETNQQFVALTKGSYAVEVSSANCTDTSACYPVINVSRNPNVLPEMRLWPNPADVGATILVDLDCSECLIQVHDLSGRRVLTSELQNGEGVISLNQTGLFVVSVYTERGRYYKLLEIR